MPAGTPRLFWPLRQAARVLQQGGIVAYPTEAVYGLGCNPLDFAAVMDLLAMKQRDPAKGLILIASNLQQLLPYLAPLSPALRKKLLASWPGPVTWLLPAGEHTPAWLTGSHDSLAVRVTAHPLAAALCDAFGGAIVSTSANIANRPPARSALAVRKVFPGQLDYILTGATGGRSRPSEIRDARSGKILRKG
jgi:L-threonylcarbamoyladenylate synthase